jgi:hypothetical protein
MRTVLLVALVALGGCGDGVTVVTLQARPAVRPVDELVVTVANDNATRPRPSPSTAAPSR